MAYEAVGIVACLLLHSLFAGVEMALVSCSHIRMRHLSHRGMWRANLVERFKAHPERFLGTMLVAINIMIVVESVLANRLIVQFSETRFQLLRDWSSVATTVIMVPLVLLVGEVLPKSLFHQFADRAALAFVIPLRILHLVLFPVVSFFTGTGRGLARLFGVRTEEAKRILSREELQIMVREAARVPEFGDEDRAIVQRIFHFKETRAEEVMLPLDHVNMAPAGGLVRDVLELVWRTGNSRIPLYETDRSEIVGYVRSTELAGLAPNVPVSTARLEPLRVAHTEPIRRLLRVFQEGGRHLAIVDDESGSALGIITLEDVIEEIVGEIEDEYDR